MQPRKLEFLMCGSPNDAFWSQAAVYRFFLDAFGGIYRDARLVLCLADHEQVPLPARWQPHFARIEVHWAPVESFLAHGDGSDFLLTLPSPEADLTFVCDADTLLVRPFPDTFLEEMMRYPAIGGCIAHGRPPLVDASGHDYSAWTSEAFWDALSEHVLGRRVALPNRYTLIGEHGQCPFYINYGFVAGTPSLIRRLHAALDVVQPRIRQFLDNDFYGQIGIALAVEHAGLKSRVLPLRYNFPNDPQADALHPQELRHVHVIHYLRKQWFDRHRIFASADAFDAFLQLALTGSNAAFQNHVRSVTGSRYPFS